MVTLVIMPSLLLTLVTAVLATAAAPPPDLAPLLALGLGKYRSNKENVSFQNLPSLKHGFGEV